MISFQALKRPHLLSVYGKEEIQFILKTAGCSICNRKCNHAILLLVVRMGMRTSDFRSLQFENTDWSESLEYFLHQKTKVPVELPLPKVAGEALVDYQKHSRTAFESNKVLWYITY